MNKELNYLFNLSYLAVLDVVGEKAVEFLQGQLSCDVRKLSDIQIVQGALCNLKGRILALIDVCDWQGVRCILRQDLLEPTVQTLSKTAQLSRVSLRENKALKVFGFYLQNNNDLIPGSSFLPPAFQSQAYSANYCYYHLGDGFYVFLVKEEFEDEFLSPFILKDQVLEASTWHRLRLQQLQFEIYPQSRGLFLPHRLGLHQTPYISFDKGCYKGQEIIARTHYRATLKHELRLYTITAEIEKLRSDQPHHVTSQDPSSALQAPSPRGWGEGGNEGGYLEAPLYCGQKLLEEAGGRELGELIDYAKLGKELYLIAVSVLKEPIKQVVFDGHLRAIDLSLINF